MRGRKGTSGDKRVVNGREKGVKGRTEGFEWGKCDGLTAVIVPPRSEDRKKNVNN